MRWTKVSDYVMETECGRYRCRKYSTSEDVVREPGERRYQLYGPNSMRLGPPQESFVAVKQFAQAVA